MSPKSTRKVNKHEKYKNSRTSSPSVFENNVEKPSIGSINRVRRIRKTNDMICFDTSVQENNLVKNQTPAQKSPLSKINEFSSPFFKDISFKSSATKLDVTATATSDDIPVFFSKKATNDTSNGKFVKSATFLEKSESKKQPEKRKIIKARRFFKNNNEAHVQTVEREDHTPHVEITKDTTATFTEQENPQTNEEIWIEDEEHIPIKKESLNIHEMIVKTLPSPIAPSESSIEINNHSSTLSQHLKFNSSKEDLHPSTSGIVDSTKRRTYELEDSIIDLSLLKSASDRDSGRINSFPSSDTQDYKTPSRVTTRRKWNKPQHFSAHLSDSPKWINRSQKKSSSFAENYEKRELVVSAAKKFISKVKVPNFAAIHAKALEKIESISEYKQRKDDRAKALLSGLKPNVQKSSSKKENQSGQKSSNKKESRKQLRFAPNTTLKDKSPTFIPLPSTPLPKKHVVDSPLSPLVETTKFNFLLSKEHDFIAPVFKAHNVEKKVLTKKNSYQEDKKFNFVFSKDKFTHIPVFTQANVEKRVLTAKNYNVKETFKGFSSVKNDAQKNQIKSIVTKSNPVQNTLQLRRCAIKGVRSNRRFELLMNMRKGK